MEIRIAGSQGKSVQTLQIWWLCTLEWEAKLSRCRQRAGAFPGENIKPLLLRRGSPGVMKRNQEGTEAQGSQKHDSALTQRVRSEGQGVQEGVGKDKSPWLSSNSSAWDAALSPWRIFSSSPQELEVGMCFSASCIKLEIEEYFMN